jgi:Protein of unknown function (DUF2510)
MMRFVLRIVIFGSVAIWVFAAYHGFTKTFCYNTIGSCSSSDILFPGRTILWLAPLVGIAAFLLLRVTQRKAIRNHGFGSAPLPLPTEEKPMAEDAAEPPACKWPYCGNEPTTNMSATVDGSLPALFTLCDPHASKFSPRQRFDYSEEDDAIFPTRRGRWVVNTFWSMEGSSEDNAQLTAKQEYERKSPDERVEVEYDMAGISSPERSEFTKRLDQADIPWFWRSGRLVVYKESEQRVDEMFQSEGPAEAHQVVAAPAQEATPTPPTPPPSKTPVPPPPGTPAGWLADPVGKYGHRYWDGSRWTEHVSGVAGPSTDFL